MIRKTDIRMYALIGLLVTVPACISSTAAPAAPTPTFSDLGVSTQTTATLENTAIPTFTVVVLTPAITATEQPGTTQADTGWQGEYYNNNAFQEPVTLTRMDADLIFDWKDGSPDPSIPSDNFSVRWTRCLHLEERFYIFTVKADENAKVLVDDIPVLETPFILGRPFAVSAGEHCIKVEYKELGESASIDFSFKAGEALNTGDASTAWKGEYFNNSNFLEPITYTSNDPALIFDWGEGNPAPGMPFDNFSVRWTRCLDLEGREYIFRARADDYVRVLIDDVQVLEAPILANVAMPIAMSAGRHCMKVEYREDGGTAGVYFTFE